MTWSSRVKVESQELSSHFRVIGLQDRVNESRNFTFFYDFLCYEKAPNIL